MTDPVQRWPETIPADLANPATTVADAVRLGQRITIIDPVRFHGKAANFAVLRLLGAAMEVGLRTDWTLDSVSSFDLDDLDNFAHWPPPTRALTRMAQHVLEQWQERHRPGLCSYRYGPDFVAIKDVRRSNASFRATLDEPYVARFRALTAATRVDELSSDESALLAELRAHGLALIDGTHFLLSPYRIRTFPIPFSLV